MVPAPFRQKKRIKEAAGIIFSGLGKTLFIWFLVISLVPVTVVSLVSYMNARISLKADAEQSLAATLKLKKEYLDAYFAERLNDLALQSELDNNVQLLQELRQAYLGSRFSVSHFIDSATWHDITANHKKGLANFAAIYGYYDVLLIDIDGNILFSVMGEDDLGTNIFTDAFAETQFAKASWETLETGLPMGADLEAYAPAKKALVLFFVQAMKNSQGETIGLLAFKLPIHQINDIMQVKTGLGKTGQTYLVGRDMLMRSDATMYKYSTMLKQKVETKEVRDWLASQDWYYEADSANQSPQPPEAGEGQAAKPQSVGASVNIYAGPQGRQVLGTFISLDSLEKLGLHWAMIAEINADEAFGPALVLRKIVFGLATVTGILVVILSLTVTRRIILPVRNISGWAKRVASGQLAYETIDTGKNEIGELNTSFKLVVDSFKNITDVCQAVADGDYSKSVAIRSEHDVLGRSVNRMAENLRSVVRQANAVAEGDYSRVITPKSEKDELEMALMNMTSRLREMTENNDKQDWLKAGYNELNNAMRGEQDVATLSNNIIDFLANYLNSFVGALYVVQDDGLLLLTGGYAHKDGQARIMEVFHPGEGLVGQAARTGRLILISEVPEDYVKIESGTGNTIPHGLLVMPFSYENRVTGVIELGAFYRFSDLQIDFLRGVVQNIGIALNTAKSRSLMAKLLEETKDQAEKLRAQQVELWKSNEVLEEQTKALEESEKHLQSQQEELRVANEELEERTQALEEQRDAIRKKNMELEKAQLEIQKKAKDLELANRYKSEFLANMSHELRTPLNSILILSQLLGSRDTGNLTEKQIEYAKTIHSSGSDLLTLINEILDLAKVESGRMELHLEDMELTELTGNMEKLFKPMAIEKGIELNLTLGSDLPAAIRTDSQRLQQIVKNLISNAFKFTSTGSVTLAIDRCPVDIRLNRTDFDPTNALAIAVRDTGIGIPADKQELIFEAFQQADGTTSRQYGGTGLGLSISREFAKFLGGELRLTSKVGEGSTFTIYLPLVFKAAAAAAAAPENTGKTVVRRPPAALVRKPPPKSEPGPVTPAFAGEAENQVIDDRKEIATGDKLLLVIEDDANFAKILVEQARQKGFKCLIAEDGESGLHFADYYRPSAIILDIGLPGIDGWEVMERLKENPDTRHIPVHFMSAIDKSMDAMKMGAVGYLTKPVSLDKLNEAFKNIENMAVESVKRLLIVEDDDLQRRTITELIGNGDVETTAVSEGAVAYDLLNRESFDCVILDLGLRDMTGFELLEKIKNDERMSQIPIIVYTGRDLTRQEETDLKRYTDSIIVKGVKSAERLLDEANLFLHRVEANLPEAKQRKMRLSFDKEAVFKDKKVLLVDDDMRNIFAIGSVLEGKGMKLIVARNGRESLARLESDPRMDLVLMDIMMPEMDGYEAMRKIRAQVRFKTLPVIALTAKAMKGDRNKCIEAGANDYLAKPVDIDKLLSLLRVWLYQQNK